MNLVEAAKASANKPYIPYNRFLDASDKNEINTEVLPPLKAILPNGQFDAGPAMAKIVIDYNEFKNEPGDDCAEDPEAVTLAYTDPSTNRIHFCLAAYELPELLEITCAKLDAYPSYKADNLARLAIHETLHTHVVGKDT
jgi:hypothetical protein